MPRTRRGQAALRIFCAVAVLNRERLFPILPVAIFEPHRNGRADGLSMAHAGQNIRLIFFDALARPPPKSQLPPVEFAPNEFQVHGHTRGQPGNPGD